MTGPTGVQESAEVDLVDGVAADQTGAVVEGVGEALQPQRRRRKGRRYRTRCNTGFNPAGDGDRGRKRLRRANRLEPRIVPPPTRACRSRSPLTLNGAETPAGVVRAELSRGERGESVPLGTWESTGVVVE